MTSWRTFGLLALTLLAMAQLNAASKILKKCTSDMDCPKSEFCKYKQGFQFCMACVKCSERYARLPPRSDSCAKTANECGACMPGFHEVLLSSDKRSNYCQPKAEVISTAPAAYSGGRSYTATHSTTSSRLSLSSIILLVLGVVIFGAAILMFSVSWGLSRHPRREIELREPVVRYSARQRTPPPPYVQQSNPCVSEAACTTINVVQEQEAKCDAEVFQQPTYARASMEIVLEEDIVLGEDEPGLNVVAAPEGHEDSDVLSQASADTEPSEWRPSAQYPLSMERQMSCQSTCDDATEDELDEGLSEAARAANKKRPGDTSPEEANDREGSGAKRPNLG